jgi:hypothetical protein
MEIPGDIETHKRFMREAIKMVSLSPHPSAECSIDHMARQSLRYQVTKHQ